MRKIRLTKNQDAALDALAGRVDWFTPEGGFTTRLAFYGLAGKGLAQQRSRSNETQWKLTDAGKFYVNWLIEQQSGELHAGIQATGD